MAHTEFVKAALAILATEAGNLPCVDEVGRPSTLRKCWPVPQLQLWEDTEGEDKTGIPTMTHWRSYTGL